MRTRFTPDRGLTARMGFTVLLLLLVYVGFVAALVVLLGRAWPVVIVVALGFLAVQYWFGDRMALLALRGREVGPEEAPVLHGTVDRLCALADMAKPRVAIAETDVPNAFATGRSPERAVVCVTTGLLRRLDDDELEAVLSHELAHVAHRDVVVMTVASFLGVLAGLIARFGLELTFWGGGGLLRGGDRESSQSLPAWAVLLLVLAVSAVVYALSFLLVRALSRYRELSADRAGAHLTGRPSALASALTRISGEMATIPTRDLRAAEPLSALLLVPAVGRGVSLAALFATHPPLHARLEQLGRISAELGRG